MEKHTCGAILLLMLLNVNLGILFSRRWSEGLLRSEDDSPWRSFRGENFQSCPGRGKGGINSAIASLHSFIKRLTILPVPVLINLPPPSSFLHTLSQLSQHPHTRIHVACVCGCLVCVWCVSAHRSFAHRGLPQVNSGGSKKTCFTPLPKKMLCCQV